MMTDTSKAKITEALRAFGKLTTDERQTFHCLIDSGLIGAAEAPRKRGRPAGSKNKPVQPQSDLEYGQ